VTTEERLDFQLCGEFRVSRSDEDLVLTKTARQGRHALAYLALHHDQAIDRGKLLQAMFTDRDPQRAGASLSQTLSRLRSIVGPDRLEKLPSGAVRLRGPVRIDVEVAKDRLAASKLALARGDCASAAEVSDAVLRELDGDVLAGDEAEWLDEVRNEVADCREEALEARATAALRLGDWSAAVTAARALVAASPTRETGWSLLIEAQAGQGDAGLAAQTYDEFRRSLMDELGLRPSDKLRELHTRLVKGELTVDAGRRPNGSVAFPSALSLETRDKAFVGRDARLRGLRRHYSRAREGTRQFVVLCGEPGIGKTRLAAEFAREIHDGGATVLYGRSDRETLVPYQPFVAAIGHYVIECGDAALARELGPELSELSRLIPSLARRIPQLREPLAVEPEMRRYRLFNAVVSVLGLVARERPAVLVLDDLQWADPSTVLLLRHTVEEIGDVKLLILGTFRDGENCGSEQLIELVTRPRPGFERLTLGGLDAGEVGALVKARQGRDATDRAVGVLLEATGGNPLLLEETLKVLAESDPPPDGLSERAVRRVGLPEGAKHVIGRRLEQLTATAQRVLADASVVGVEFGVALLEGVSEAPAEQVIPALESAAAAGLVREVRDAGDCFTFSHALVRETLLDAQSTPRRRRLHHKIGEALEASSATVHPAELAHHFIESHDPADADKALKYSLEAGDRATRSLAHEDAADHFERALRLLPPGDERRRCALLLELGRVQLRQGCAEARATFRLAFGLAGGAPEQLAQAALGFASRYPEAGVIDTEAIALLRAAREAVGDDPRPQRVALTARLADSLHFAPEPDDAQRLSREALTMARAIADPRALAVALESRHAALLSIEHLDERLQLSHDLLELARQEGERELMALGHHWRTYDLLEAARVAEARGEREALAALADELRQPLYHHFAVGWDVVWAHMAGEVDKVEALAERFKELGIEAQARDTETIYRAQIMALRRRQERLPEFFSTVRAAVEADPTLLAWRAVLPLTHLASGDPSGAVAEFEWLAHQRFSRVRHDMFWLTTMCVLAETCALLRDGGRAQVLYELLEPFRERNVQVGQAACWGSVERFLGLLADALGRWQAAGTHLESAIARNKAVGNPAAAWIVQRDLAKLLLARRGEGDLDRAAELLREPLTAAEATRIPSLIACIRGELEAVERERATIAHA
jgi:DNA-binding SARP family transcriptional activator